VSVRSRVPGIRWTLGLALTAPFWIAACGGDAESAPDLEGEGFAPAASMEDAAVAPTPAQPAPAPSSSVPARSAQPAPAAPAASAGEAAPAAGVAEAPAPAAEVPPVSIASGTRIPAVMEAALSTRTHRVGDVFHARVTEEVLAADGMVLIPEGARLEGRVGESRQSTSAQEEALLLLTFEALLINGDRFPLDATVVEAEVQADAQASGARTAATVATGAAAGAVVGRILGRDTRSTIGGAAVGAAAGAGVALTSRDGHAEMLEGARLVIRLESPTVLVAGG